MGHYWYADECISEFVRAAHARVPDALFAVTGDHPSRIGESQGPDPKTSRTVPLILFGPRVLAGVQLREDTRGSHMDIGPTLVELSAPKGFPYSSLGSSLLNANGHPIGIGHYTVVGGSEILDLRHRPRTGPDSKGADSGATDSGGTEGPPGDILPQERWPALHDAVHALAWWRIMRGAELPAE